MTGGLMKLPAQPRLMWSILQPIWCSSITRGGFRSNGYWEISHGSLDAGRSNQNGFTLPSHWCRSYAKKEKTNEKSKTPNYDSDSAPDGRRVRGLETLVCLAANQSDGILNTPGHQSSQERAARVCGRRVPGRPGLAQ